MRGIVRDDKARVSFAIMGVLILILGGFSVMYLASVNKDHVADRIEETNFARMRNVASLVHEEVETQGYYHALSSVYTATQIIKDQKQIMPLFNTTFWDYINESFPRKENNFLIEVENFTTGIFLKALKTHDIVPTNEQENQTLEGKDKEVESKTIKNDKAGEYNETSCLTYYTLSGAINYTISDTKSARFLKKSLLIDKRIESAFPLLGGKLDVLDEGTKGSSTPIPRTVKYILTTLAQYRVIQGYGMGEIAAVTIDLPDKGTSEILTKTDVELAVNLALLLETARLYRTYDDDALEAIDDRFQDLEEPNFQKIGDTRMRELVDDYVNNGTVDPADIIALFLGLENEKINIEAIMAQAIYAIADQFILKYLDYFNFMDLIDPILVGVQILANAMVAAGKAVDDFFGWMSGESPHDRNKKRLKWWLKETLLEKADLPDTLIMHDTTSFIESKTYTITLTKSGICLKEEDTDNDPLTPNETVEYTWSTTIDYEVETQSGDYDVIFLEKDILRESVMDLWYDPDTKSDFYDQRYGTNLNRIYVSLRQVVMGVIAEVVKIITGSLDLDISSYRIFNRPKDIDPKDEISLLEEIRFKVDSAITAIRKYFSGDEGKNRFKNVVAKLTDEHARAIGELQHFIVDHFDEFADKDVNIQFAKWNLARNLISDVKVTEISRIDDGESPDCVPPEPFSESDVKDKFREEKFNDVRMDMSSYATQAFQDVKAEELSVDNNGKDQKPLYIIGGLQNVIDRTGNIILDLIASAVHGFGLIPMACALVRFFSDEIIFGGEVVNTKYLQYTKLGVPFGFWEDDYELASTEGRIGYETLRVNQEPNYLSEEHLEIEISKPKGTHYTAINSLSTRPFETNWGVSVSGDVELKTRTNSRIFLKDGTHEHTKDNRTIKIDISLTITVYSGWGLGGVDYELSNTLLGDVLAFLTQVWDHIVSVVGAIFDILSKLIESFMNLLTKLISYVAEIIKVIVDTIQAFVQLIRDFIQFILDSIIKSIIEVVADVIGDGFSITIFGFTFTIRGNKEIADDSSADGNLFWVSTSGGIVGVDMNFTLRFARYHQADDDDPHYDILLDGKVKIGDFRLEVGIDPMMKINSHIVEGHGMSVSEEGSGWGLDFYVPEVEEYKEVSWTLRDTVGDIICIPIPFLGVKATVDAGFVIQYNAPKGNTVVINEFELNPQGEDGGGEWFEIYNPTGDDIGSWRISSAKGGILRKELSELDSVNDGEYVVFSLPKEVLENGKAKDPFSPGDGLILMNESDAIIDRTPIYKDPGDGDKNTWQRTYDGSVIWKLKESTKLEQNGEGEIDIKTVIKDALNDSFRLAWNEFWDKEFSLESIVEFVQDWIHNFIEMVVTVISHVVQKVYIFFDLEIEDVSGSAGGGIRISLGIDGEGVVALLRWLIETIETFIHNICDPSNPKDYPTIPKSIPEQMYVRFEVYFEIGTPKIIQKISTEPPPDCRLSIAVQVNIPALVALIGWDWGDWEVIFGVYLARFPSRSVSNILGTSDDKDTYVDLWLLKARVYEIT
ncbi:MAG: hypothetical protein JSV09_16435 [Thermoplasmata archaeon]|nr:MAG: hypothetical protein JSV09_16435 [Thermoplasmata archaeon]